MVEELGGLDGVLNSEKGSKKIKVSETNLPSAKLLMIYLTMTNCPPCNEFTPLLTELYGDDDNVENKNFEVVAIVAEPDETKYNEYISNMPFHVLPHKDSRCKAISKKYKVRGIPRLIVLNAQTGEVVNDNAKELVEQNGPAVIE